MAIDKALGDVMADKKYRRGIHAPPLRDRILQKIRIDSASGCWTWLGAKQKSGHGHMTVNGAKRYAEKRIHHAQ